MPSVIKALVFAASGTLFDVHSVVTLCDRLFPGRGTPLSQLWRAKQLEYTWQRSLMGRYVDFAEITRDALEYACKVLHLPLAAGTSAQLMAAYDSLVLYPEARDALAALPRFKIAILSNGSPAMLDPLVENAGLDKLLHSVLSVDAVKAYKPDPRVYQLAVGRLGVAAAEIGFVSANYWDAAGASSFGFRVFWINRSGIERDRLGAEPHLVLQSLAELAASVGY